MPTVLSLLLLAQATSQAQGTAPKLKAPGDAFEYITDAGAIKDLESTFARLQETKKLAEFGSPFLGRIKPRWASEPEWERNSVYLFRNLDVNPHTLVFWRAGETPLARGFRMKVRWVCRGKAAIVKYYKFLPDAYAKYVQQHHDAPVRNFGLVTEPEFSDYIEADVVIALDNAYIPYKILDSRVKTTFDSESPG